MILYSGDPTGLSIRSQFYYYENLSPKITEARLTKFEFDLDGSNMVENQKWGVFWKWQDKPKFFASLNFFESPNIRIFDFLYPPWGGG